MTESFTVALPNIIEIIVPIFAIFGYTALGINALLTGNIKSSRTICFAIAMLGLGFYFLVEFFARVTQAPNDTIPLFWVKAWWVAGLVPSLFWFATVFLLVEKRLRGRWRNFYRTVLAVGCLAGILLLVGGLSGDNFTDRFGHGGQYYNLFQVYVLVALLLTLHTLLNGYLRRTKLGLPGQDGSLRLFFYGTMFALVGVGWMSYAVREGAQSPLWLRQLVLFSSSVGELPQWPGEFMLLICKFLIASGVRRNTQVFARRISRYDWLWKLSLLDVIAFVLIIGLFLTRLLHSLIPLIILPVLATLAFYFYIVRRQEKNFRKLADTLTGLTTPNFGFLQPLEMKEEDCKETIAQIFKQLVATLELKRAILVLLDYRDQLDEQLTFDHNWHAPLPALEEDTNLAHDEAVLSISLGEAENGTQIGRLILGPKETYFGFEEQEVQIARLAANRIAEIWSMGLTMGKFKNYLNQEADRLDHIPGERREIIHKQLIAVLQDDVQILLSRLRKQEGSDENIILEEAVERLNQVVSDARLFLTLDGTQARYPDILFQDGVVRAITHELIPRYTSRFASINWQPAVTDEQLHRLLLWPRRQYLYAAIEEAVKNAARHASDGRILADLAIELDIIKDGSLRILVKDNGRGFLQNSHLASTGHFGLSLQSNRLSSIGGCVKVRSRLGMGTQVRILLPPIGSVLQKDGVQLA